MSPATGPRELKKGSAELLILSLVDDQARHGYDIARMIEVRSKGALAFHAASMYPLLYRLERRSLIKGRWVEKAGERRRRLYRITAKGREVLAEEIKEEANDVLGYAPNPKKKNKRNRPEDDGPVLAVLFNQFMVQYAGNPPWLRTFFPRKRSTPC